MWCLFPGDFCFDCNYRPLPVLKEDGAAQEGETRHRPSHIDGISTGKPTVIRKTYNLSLFLSTSKLCLCSLGCPRHLHPLTLCPHSTGSNSPVWLRGSSVSGHLGSGRAPKNAQITPLCFRDKDNPDKPHFKAECQGWEIGNSQWTFGLSINAHADACCHDRMPFFYFLLLHFFSVYM